MLLWASLITALRSAASLTASWLHHISRLSLKSTERTTSLDSHRGDLVQLLMIILLSWVNRLDEGAGRAGSYGGLQLFANFAEPTDRSVEIQCTLFAFLIIWYNHKISHAFLSLDLCCIVDLKLATFLWCLSLSLCLLLQGFLGSTDYFDDFVVEQMLGGAWSWRCRISWQWIITFAV